MRVHVVLAAIFAALFCYPFNLAIAQTTSGGIASDGADWIRLGEIRLARFITQDTVELSADSPAVAAVRLVAKGGDVTISRVQVFWANDDLHTEDRTIHLFDGERTRPISPAKEGARILRVGVLYSIPPSQRAEVRLEVWGFKASSPRAPAIATDAAKRGLYVHRRSVARSMAPPSPTPDSRPAAVPDTTTGGAQPPQPEATASPASTDCIAKTQCTPVPVYFGTNRLRQDNAGLIAFTQDRSPDLTLGQATVTVPRAYRKKGEIPRPSWWDLLKLKSPWSEDPSRHFAVLGKATKVYASPDDFIAAVQASMAGGGTFKDHAFVFVHGYNSSFNDALYRAAQIAYDLGENDQPFGTAFLYSWPSAGETESYVYDLESAEKAVPQLQAFLDLIVSKTGAKHVHLIAHSMGNGPLLAALDAVAKTGQARTVIDQVILAAPDVDAKDFAELSSHILPLARSVTLYASSEDRAMLASRKIRRNNPRAGDVINGVPVIVKDLDSIDVTSVGTSIFSYNHNIYADRKELLNDMRRLMLTNERPPDVRDISIRRVTDKTGTFWRFVN